MDKSLRGHYLKTMGVVEYVPKNCEADFDEPEETVIKTGPSDRDHIPPVSSTSRDIEYESSNTIDLEKNQWDKASSSINEPFVEVKLAIWQPVDEILVCAAVDNELPNPDQLELLTNIITAMINEKVSLPQLEILQWPPYEKVQGGEKEARDFITTFISAKLEAGIINLVLFCGESARDWVLSGDHEIKSLDGYISRSKKIDFLLIPSLQEMLDKPALKQNAWNILKPHSKFSHS